MGPGPLVAAAFIGPGTVTLCTIAGVEFGYVLLWALLLSIFATIILQEMAARLGIVTQKSLSETISAEIKQPLVRKLVLFLILSAIVVGNTAYEAGNISGGILGLETVFGNFKTSIGATSFNLWSLVVGFFAFIILFIGNYKVLERLLVGLVIIMSLAFLFTAVMVGPDIAGIFKGMVLPSLPDGSLLTVIGLIGTTVVPYNIFLHASLAKEKWQSTSDISTARTDTVVAVVVGGIVSMCIMICAASIDIASVNNASDLALALEPLFGVKAKYVLSIGLFAAGLTSAITAPLAAAYVAVGCMGWPQDLKSRHFRSVWIAILIIGVLSAASGVSSIEIIKFAQIANGLVLPLVAIILVRLVSQPHIMGRYVNSPLQRILAWTIVGVSLFLGLKGIFKVFGLI
ncbi:Nramp family divalent metal transporter [Winogradskyella maritima]|nr:Nramp family divalent metal transporter [Winogradskyella maritima]